MNKILISSNIDQLFRALVSKKAVCKLSDLFLSLPEYLEEQPEGTKVFRPFLADLVLTDLQLPTAPEARNITFTAKANSPDFLSQSLCFAAVRSMNEIQCSFMETEDGQMIFTGIYSGLSGAELVLSQQRFPVTEFQFSSGTDAAVSMFPMFTYVCVWNVEGRTLDLFANQAVGTRECVLEGAPKEKETFSMTAILKSFGIEKLEFDSLLPVEFSPSLFASLVLSHVAIVEYENQGVGLSFDVMAQEPLELFDAGISFQPGFHINIMEFCGRQDVGIYAYGQLSIGSTGYEVVVIPDTGEISLCMKQGDALDLGAIASRFFNTQLPSLTFDQLYASMNFKTHAFQFGLRATDVLTFSIAKKTLSIESIGVQVWVANAQFAVTLQGRFDIAGFPFTLVGAYSGVGYSLASCITEGTSVKMSELLSDYVGSACLLGQAFDFTISQLSVHFETGTASSFGFDVAASFCGNDDTLKKLFDIGVEIQFKGEKLQDKWSFCVNVGCKAEIGESQFLTCGYHYSSDESNANVITLSYEPATPKDVVTLGDILYAVGFKSVDGSWSFLTEIGLTKVALSYDFQKKLLYGQVNVSGGGYLKVSVFFGENPSYSITLHSSIVISLADVPVAGGLVTPFLSSKENLSIRDLTFYALSVPDQTRSLPAGVRLAMNLLGEQQSWQIYEPKPVRQNLLAERESAPKIFWIKLDKTVAIFTLHRVGLGLDGSYLMLVLDSSLNVSPLTFRLYGAGIGVNLSDFDLKFYFTGFGVSFQNPTMTISGDFTKKGNDYTGTLLIRAAQFSIFAIAEYAEEGNLFAYAVLTAKLGGPPALFITGLALGFGYNKRIVMPGIEAVANFPLIKGAMGKLTKEGMLAELDQYVSNEKGQKFLAAGIRFTSFEIAESFALLTISFGNSFEIDLLGISDITMPPQCPENTSPIAHAQLALKAAFKPEEGFFGVEARLTSESYILSKDCQLTGGFAFYLWFGGDRAGDFVITLGGYHPKYALTKPEHYPDVPRVGFLWKIGNYVNITGEVYFALTPNALMAGGRLSMTYTMGNLKAYFIAQADFLIGWKPFHYDIHVGVMIGASYHVKLWFVSFSLSLELGADLHIWGPDFTGTARISLWIFSFDINFGASASQEAESLDWDGFCTAFLPKGSHVKTGMLESGDSADNVVPLTISLGEGLNGQVLIAGREIKSVNAGNLEMAVDSVLPIQKAEVNGNDVAISSSDICVRPMGKEGENFSSFLKIKILGELQGTEHFEGVEILKNIPTAMWGGEGELLYNIPCGVGLRSSATHEKEVIFPKKQWISLEDLYQKGATIIENAFLFQHPAFPAYTDQDTISVFQNTVNDPEIRRAREQFLNGLGISGGDRIDLSRYAAQAESYLDEEVWIVSPA